MDHGTLLLVDDEQDMLDVLVQYLSGLGYTVLAATSAAETLVRLASVPRVDVAVVDWTLPDGTGRDVISAVRARHPDCRFVVTTGHGSDLVNEPYGAAGLAGGILRKPFTMRTLYQRVALLLEQARTAS